MSKLLTQSEIDTEIEELRARPGVKVEKVKYAKVFHMVLVYGSIRKDNGIEIGIIAYYKKAED